MNIKKKVLLIIPNLDFGGAQRVFKITSDFLSDDYDVVECVFNLEEKRAYPSKHKTVALNVPAGTHSIDKFFRFLQRCIRYTLLRYKEKPLLSFSHLEGADYVNLLSFGPGKNILVVHGSKVYDEEIKKSFGWLRHKLMLPLLYRRADHIVTVSEGIKEELVQHYKIPQHKIKRIYNSFNIQELKDQFVEQIEISTDRKFILLTSGRLAIQKNQLPILSIIHRLKTVENYSVQLHIIGSGSLLDLLKKRCTELKLSVDDYNENKQAYHTDIVFFGFQNNPFKFYGNATLFILTSSWEGFPMALGEAMALGIPVVSSDCPTGPAELIVENSEFAQKSYPIIDKNGVLLPIPQESASATIDLWTQTVANLLNNESLRVQMSKSAKKRMEVLDAFNIKKEWLQISNILNV